MKKFFSKVLMLIGFLVFVTACTTFDFLKLNYLQKGMNQGKVIEIMDKDPDIKANIKVPELDSISLQFYDVPQYYYSYLLSKTTACFSGGCLRS